MDSIMNAFMHMLNTQLILLVYLLIGVILQYATLVNNSGFMGLPLVESMYGADADFGSRCVIATTVMCLFTAPLLMLLA